MASSLSLVPVPGLLCGVRPHAAPVAARWPFGAAAGDPQVLMR